jgi:hypothetical protein
MSLKLPISNLFHNQIKVDIPVAECLLVAKLRTYVFRVLLSTSLIDFASKAKKLWWALYGRAHPRATEKIKNRKKRKLMNFSLS